MVESVVIIELNSCKNNCLFCNPQGFRRDIPQEELRRIEIHLLKQALNLRKKGFREVEISGCDPIEYSKIADFVQWLKEAGFQYVLLSTHGRNLSERDLVDYLRNARLDELRIPLYGSNAEIHDSVTQARGSFNETLQGIKNIRGYAPNIHLKLTSLIMRQNYKDIANILSLASSYTDDIVFSIPCLPEQADSRNIAIPFGEAKPYILSLLDFSEEKNISVKITDIPFCILGFYDERLINKTAPPVTAAYSIPEQFASAVPNIPSYRIKTKLEVCNECSLSNKCDGFYKSYASLFNLSHLKPL